MESIKKKSMSKKLRGIYTWIALFTLVAHIVTYVNIRQTMTRFDLVYASNIKLNELVKALEAVQKNMYTYLSIKSSNALEDYYVSVNTYETLLNTLNGSLSEQDELLMGYYIKNMSKVYLEKTSEAVQAKRGRNISKYNASYNDASEVMDYISAYIRSLNSLKFRENSENYLALRHTLQNLEIISSLVMVGVIVLNAFIIILLTRRLTEPLMNLAKTAEHIAKGNLEVPPVEVNTGDEIEVLSRAFNQMVRSIKEYINRLRISLEAERKMQEKELLMENHLKDAELKYLQAQINPHFLFNTLNAGMQLAILEEAEQTAVFIENMAAFFRYNITGLKENTTLEEEIKLVDHYIYILNVRFQGEINYSKEVNPTLLQTPIPSMMIQPIVENVFNYGIRGIEWEGRITLSVYKEEEYIIVCVADNGRGMSKERIEEVLSGKVREGAGCSSSNGIGLNNVMGRLKLYYGKENLLRIESQGENQGTKVYIMLPCEEQGGGGIHV